ncbi:MAG: hypothetical protein AB2672_07855 [Candidatus Thiodiazotropha endolucinida]|nr:hypothetical protein [Candidatus Thiodiazotropha sp. (ex Lucina pensylvanica)]MCG7879532.1 hypothetical protein [Candidatus Thiodiazotropha taylori]MCG8025611.1 hypothetical protein [Candidatus Thiodiazotropha endolucinida]MCG7882630.1 hypothetical protein [Candidatus Thiodiazotropha taylori]MCG7886608.1 hypothetical protein [Candidatus Thiodiazotropha taylori]
MNTTNQDLCKIMHDKNLSCNDVAKVLDVPLETVEAWTCSSEENGNPVQMPELDLRMLKYSLMTENTRYHLF